MTTTHDETSISGFTVEEERAQLRLLTEYAPDAVVIIDESGRIIEWNPRASEMFGWTSAEAIGNNVGELIVPPRYRESHERWIERFSSGAFVDERRRLLGLCRDGSEISVEVTVWSLADSGIDRTLCSAFIRDLTASEQAAETRARLAAIVDSSQDAIIGMNLDGEILSWNRGAQSLYGYTPEEVLGRHISFMIPSDRSGDAAAIIDRLVRGESFDDIDTVRVAKTGGLIDVSMSVFPIVDGHGNPIGASSIARDIRERKRHEEESLKLNEELERRVEKRTAELAEANLQLEQLVASKTDFVASVSHELRTPLTSVIGFAELLMEGAAEFDSGQRLDLLGAIADQGYELANIVDDLLVAARAEIGDLNVSSVSVNLRAQTAQVLESMRNEEARAIEIAGSAHYVLADPQRVRQVLRNLLTNAIRYGGSKISVAIGESVDGLASITVADDGEGISDDARERIFELYTTESDQKPISGSFGLGLAISRALARLMGGDLEYRRTDQTEFILKLPVDESRYSG